MVNFWHDLPAPIIGLAPMDGVTDAAFRLVVARQGKPDVSFTEFTSVGDVCRGPDHALGSLVYHECERPVVAQLYGKDPTFFYQAAHAVCELGFDGLDINMGCPSKNVASSGSGAGLIRTPDLAQQIMGAARRGIMDWAAGQSPAEAGMKLSRENLLRQMNVARTGRPSVARRVIPLSVKTRIGYDRVVVGEWICRLLEERPAVISVHGRTLEQMYRGQADWDAIGEAARLVRGTGTLLLGNGDVQSMETVIQRVCEAGVQGVLVGRGTLGQPWFFQRKDLARDIIRTLTLGCRTDGQGQAPRLALDRPVSLEERFLVMGEHARQFERIFGRDRFPRMRKHLGWYCKGFPGAASMRARMVRAYNSEDVHRIVEEYHVSEYANPVGQSDLALGAPRM